MTAVPQIMSSGEPMILARDLMTELTAVVNTLGGHKVIVGFSGDGAFCDKDLSYVNIPALPETDFIPVRVAQYIRGFAAHEAAHIAFTDPTIDIVRKDGEKDGLLHTIWNCIEDYMIENYWLSLYPGAKKNFAATEVYACEGYFKSHAKNPEQVYDLRIIGGIALTWMRAVAFGLGTAESVKALDTLPADIRAKVEDWFWTLVEPVETTQDCLEAAWIIYDEIMQNPYSNQATPKIKQKLQKQAAQNAQKSGQGQPGQGQGGKPGQGQKGKGQNGQPGQGQGQGNQPGQGQGQGTQPGQGQGQGQGQGSQPGQGNQPGQQSGNQGGLTGPGLGAHRPAGGAEGNAVVDPNAQHATGFGPTPQPYPVGFDINKALKDNKITTGKDYVSVEVLSTTKEGPAQPQLVRAGGATRADDAIRHIRNAVSKTASELKRALKTYAKSRVKTGRMDGTVDSRRIAFAASGSLEYHKKVIKGLDIDTAVSVLVDCSSSMRGGEIQMCQQLALILETAFAGTPVNHEILGYTTEGYDNLPKAYQVMMEAAKKQGSHANVRAVGIYEFRAFNTPHRAAKETLGNMCNVPMGCTPTAPAILMAHDRLARRKERRHVMFVLTDGASDDSEKTRKAVEAVERCGVTVIGIGIGTHRTKNEFTKAFHIGSAVELPALMLSQLTTIILGDKHKKGMNAQQVAKSRSFAA